MTLTDPKPVFKVTLFFEVEYQSNNQSIDGIFIAPPTKHGRRRLTM